MLILHQNTLHVAYLPFVKQVLFFTHTHTYTHTHTHTSTVLALKSKFPDSAVFFKWQLPVPPHEFISNQAKCVNTKNSTDDGEF